MTARTGKHKARSLAAQRDTARTSYSQKKTMTAGAAVLEEARRAGLLDGERTEHVSFRAPKALVEAAKRESGVTKPTDLGLLALATLAQPDPTAKLLKETRGELGADHQLDYLFSRHPPPGQARKASDPAQPERSWSRQQTSWGRDERRLSLTPMSISNPQLHPSRRCCRIG